MIQHIRSAGHMQVPAIDPRDRQEPYVDGPPIDLEDRYAPHILHELEQLAERPTVDIAVDTEFEGPHTLTIQAATRVGQDIRVQLYRSTAIPELPQSFDVREHLPTQQYGQFLSQVSLCPVRTISRTLSLADILLDLIGLSGLRHYSHIEARRIINGEDLFAEPYGLPWDDRRREWILPTIHVRLIGHFLTADFCHLFGSTFHDTLFHPTRQCSHQHANSFYLHYRKLLSIASPNGPFGPPLVQLISSLGGNELFRMTFQTRDTMLPFDPGSLERHCQTFLGLGKSDALSTADKQHMLRTFRTRPAEGYGYAIVDAVNTLLVHEQQEVEHRRIYRSFGVPEDSIPTSRPTLGRRVADFLLTMVSRYVEDSRHLSPRRVKQLLQSGGRQHHARPSVSMYGAQTTGVHGGLLFSRSPTSFWHESPGQLRDVDMAGCYNRIIAEICLYCGRPLLYEPGDNRMSLQQAAEWARQHADPDAWLIRVTGDLDCWNSLIPSTLDAQTNDTLARERVDDPSIRQGAKLFSRRIESGIVTNATWNVIESLPEPMRVEYQRLSAESIVLYPRHLAATTPAEFDRLVDHHQHEQLGWKTEVDFEQGRKIETHQIDHRYVALRFPIQDIARQLSEMRERAKAEHGKGSGAEQALKLQANSMYGILASRHLPTHNFVAANIITATARANVWGLSMVLNTIQTITDGATYRRDQIPACTFRECLARCPDYPLRRPEAGEIPFLDPDQVPEDDQEFTTWLHDRACWFFEATEEFRDMVSRPALEHKTTEGTGEIAFDALAVDGCGNYLKCNQTDGQFQVHDMAMRSYGPRCREPIAEWMVETYRTDELHDLCPIVQDQNLLKLDQARQAARKALRSERDRVRLPLGMPYDRPLAYKAIKLSAFICRSPRQSKRLTRQVERFQNLTSCGLELLCLRRRYRTEGRTELSELARWIYQYIQQNGHDLSKALHLHRLSKPQQRIAKKRIEELKERRRQAAQDLRERIDVRNLSAEARTTGIFVHIHSPLLTR